MDAFWNFISTLLGLEVEPKHLTFAQISLRGVIVILFTLVIIRLGDKRSLSKKARSTPLCSSSSRPSSPAP